ncbi:MAG: proteasome assembly chaperone family protein [Thermoproteota archaeon]
MTSANQIPEVKVVETEEVEMNEPLVILGFAGSGLVGGIAVSHIIDQLDMQEIAHVKSMYMPPAVVFMEGKLRHPFRIYSDEEGKLAAVVCEVPLRSDGSYPIASALLDWIEEKDVRELVILEGAPVRGIPKKRKAFCAAEPEKTKECEEKGIEMTSAGVIRGIAGSILNECLTRKITGIAFLVPAVAFMPDPEGAATLIETLNQVYDMDLNTQGLLEKAEEIKHKLKEIAKRRQRMRQAEKEKGIPEGSYVA